MTFLWLVVWFIVRFVDGTAGQLHILNAWLLTLIVAAVLDLYRYRPYLRRWR